jgi:hypothetical protein
MTKSQRADTLNRLADDCEALRARLVRIAKALVVAEDTHAQILIRAATDARTRTAADAFVGDAEHARDLADMAAVVVTRFEQLDPRLKPFSISPERPNSAEGSAPIAM